MRRRDCIVEVRGPMSDTDLQALVLLSIEK